MLKWLSGSRPKSPQPEIVTDDPLATIPVHKLDSPLEIYAVSRVNPIFDEGGEVVVVAAGAARGSSGYGSGGGAHSPSESSEDLGSATAAAHAPPPQTAAPEGGVVPRPVWPPHQHIDSHDALYAALAKRLSPGGGAEDALRRLTQTPPGRALRVGGGGGSTTSSSSSSGFCEEPRPPPPPLYGGGSREKLLQTASATPVVKQTPPVVKEPPPQQLANRCWAGVVPGDVRLQSKDDFYWRPDFTLDRPAAERLLRTIQKAKRRRCWCRLVTCLLGLVVFLLSVMVVSLALSRGQRYFGSL